MKSGTIYVMSSPGWPGIVKVGMTMGEPLIRLARVQTGCPWRVELNVVTRLRGDVKYIRGMEAKAHELLALSCRRLGGEWFETSVDEAVRVINKVKRKEVV